MHNLNSNSFLVYGLDDIQSTRVIFTNCIPFQFDKRNKLFSYYENVNLR